MRPRASRSASRSTRSMVADGSAASRQIGVASDVPPPRMIDRDRDADAGRLSRIDRWRRAVVADPGRGLRGDGEVDAVVADGRCRTPGTASPGRCRARCPGGCHRGPPSSHRCPRAGASARSSTAVPSPSLAAHGVRAPVHAVGEVHVQVARGPEHRGVACGRAPGRRGSPDRAGRGTPRPRRCEPRRVPRTSTLLSRSGATSRASRR